MPKKAQFTHERVEYVFLFNEPLEGSKSVKILSKSVYTGENSQILTVSNKKIQYIIVKKITKHFCCVAKMTISKWCFNRNGEA
jgi:formyltetrahydrofolate synthetase